MKIETSEEDGEEYFVTIDKKISMMWKKSPHKEESTMDKMCGFYSVHRRTRTCSPVLFFQLVNIASIDKIPYNAIHIEKSHKYKTVFLKELAISLTEPRISPSERATLTTSPSDIQSFRTKYKPTREEHESELPAEETDRKMGKNNFML
ncbi:hypothetical protein JTB14_028443 [Gonioctena quinquepunctata]|nr:hypothetical protein JTB14_028443 [Gonioctena quinquepunctata]